MNIEEEIKRLQDEVAMLKGNAPEDKLSMVVCSGDLDKLLAAFIIATGSAAMFEKVVMFFTFWATPALRDPNKQPTKEKNIIEKMFGWMLPKGTDQLQLSKMHMAGMGTKMMKDLMKKKNIMSLKDLIKTAGEAGVQIYVCEMSMDLMGFSLDELIDYPNIKLAGVAKFLGEAGTSKSSLFI